MIEFKEIIIKLFDFGLYGESIKNFTEEEINKIKKARNLNPNLIEIVSPKIIEELKKKFITCYFESVDTITEDCVVRLNTLFWKNLATDFKRFNPKFIEALDYLVQNKIVSDSEVKTFFTSEIDARRFRERLLKLRLVKYDKEQCKLSYSPKFEKIEEYISGEFVQKENILENILGSPLYNKEDLYIPSNKPLILCYEEYIDEQQEGITSVELSRRFGDTVKGARSIMDRIVSKHPDKYHCIQEVIHKCMTGRIFEMRYFEKFNEKKKAKISGILGESEDIKKMSIQNLTKSDRYDLIRKFLEKYEAFPIENNIILEMANSIGYKKRFCRKNMIIIAKQMDDINVFHKSGKVVVAKKEIKENDPEVLNLFFTQNSRLKKLTAFKKKIRKFFLSKSSLVLEDNGYLPDFNDKLIVFYNYLRRFGTHCSISAKSIYELKLKEYLQMIKVYKIHFIQRLVVILYNSSCSSLRKTITKKLKEAYNALINKEVSYEDYTLLNQVDNAIDILSNLIKRSISIDLDCDIIVDGDYKAEIKILSTIVASLRLSQFIKKVNDNDLIESHLSVSKFKKFFDGLSEKNIIVMESERKNYFTIKNPSEIPESFFKKTESIRLSFFERENFVSQILNFPIESFLLLCKKYTQENYGKKVAEYLNDLVSLFIQTITYHNVTIDLTTKDHESTEFDNFTKMLYKSMLFRMREKGEEINFVFLRNVYDEYIVNFDDILPFDAGEGTFEDYFHQYLNVVLKKMIRKEILTTSNCSVNLLKLKLNPSYKAFLSRDAEDFPVVEDNLCHSDVFPGNYLYYRCFYSKIFKIVTVAGSIDSLELERKLRYLQSFEIEEFFLTFYDFFKTKRFGNFQIYSIK